MRTLLLALALFPTLAGAEPKGTPSAALGWWHIEPAPGGEPDWEALRVAPKLLVFRKGAELFELSLSAPYTCTERACFFTTPQDKRPVTLVFVTKDEGSLTGGIVGARSLVTGRMRRRRRRSRPPTSATSRAARAPSDAARLPCRCSSQVRRATSRRYEDCLSAGTPMPARPPLSPSVSCGRA